MIRFRHHWIRMIALFAVLVHGYALLSHHGVMIAMAAAGTGDTLGLGVMCRADGTKDIVDFDDLQKGGSGKPAKQMTCPVCAGAVPTAAIDAPPLLFIEAPRQSESVVFDIKTCALPVARAHKPPSTGPPTIV